MKKFILLTILSLGLLFITSQTSRAENCRYGCYPGGCPAGTSGISGDCGNTGYSCCYGTGGQTPTTSSVPTSAPTASSVATGSSSTSGFGNPLGNTKTIEAVLGNIMKYLQGIAGTIAVIFIIIGGIMYMVSGGSKETTERAKKTLICAIAGLAIVLAAPLFYTEIKAVLSGSSPGSALQQLLVNVLKLLLSIVGFLAIISMVVGGIWMLTAVGDEDRYELGKKTAGYSILGLVIALSALIIANQVTSLVGSGNSVINNAANSPVTGSTPSVPGITTPTLPGTAPGVCPPLQPPGK